MTPPKKPARSTLPRTTGLPVDWSGGPTVDPSEATRQLNEASIIRQDDLRELNNLYLKALLDGEKALAECRIDCTKDIARLRAEHIAEIRLLQADNEEKVRRAESDRLNSIRQVDREEVTKTATSAQLAISALATNTTTLAETLRTQVATVAAAAENRQAAFSSDVNKRLSALELSSSEGKGKMLVSDPQVEKLTILVENLARSRDTGQGKREGISGTVAAIIAAAGLLLTLLGIGAAVLALRPSPVAPSVVYAPEARPQPQEVRP